MKFFLSFVFILTTVSCIISGRLIHKDLGREHQARGSTGNKSKGLLWPFCKDESAMENNVIVCLACRGFSRLCFNIPMSSGVPGSNPSNVDGKPSTSTGSTSTSPTTSATVSPSSERPTTEAAKAI